MAPFALRFEDTNANSYENKSMFEINAIYWDCDYSRKKEICSSKELNLTKCKASTFPESYTNDFEFHKLDSAFCIDFDNNPQFNNNIVIKGFFGENYATKY